MVSRKRNWNSGTPLRYRGKIERVNRGIYVNPEVAERVSEAQARSWESGSGIYKKIREVAKDVMSREGTFVSPAFRAPYYAAVQKYYKDVVVIGKEPGAVRTYIETSFPGLDFGVFDAIIDALTGVGILPQLRPAERA